MMAAPDQTAGSGSSTQAPERRSEREAKAKALPFIPMRGLVAFPHVAYPVLVSRPASKGAIEYAKENELPIVVAAQKDFQILTPAAADVYHIGSSVELIDSVRLPDGTLKCAIEGRRRVRISRFFFDQDFSKAEVEEFEEARQTESKIEELIRSVVSAFIDKRVKTFAKWDTAEAWAASGPAVAVGATSLDGASSLADRIASQLPMDVAWKQGLLEQADPVQRLEKLLAVLRA